jgi:hypothetical protein
MLDEEGRRQYLVLAERLLLAHRKEYAALKGWAGPRRFKGG